MRAPLSFKQHIPSALDLHTALIGYHGYHCDPSYCLVISTRHLCSSGQLWQCMIFQSSKNTCTIVCCRILDTPKSRYLFAWRWRNVLWHLTQDLWGPNCLLIRTFNILFVVVPSSSWNNHCHIQCSITSYCGSSQYWVLETRSWGLWSCHWYVRSCILTLSLTEHCCEVTTRSTKVCWMLDVPRL